MPLVPSASFARQFGKRTGHSFEDLEIAPAFEYDANAPHLAMVHALRRGRPTSSRPPSMLDIEQFEQK